MCIGSPNLVLKFWWAGRSLAGAEEAVGDGNEMIDVPAQTVLIACCGVKRHTRGRMYMCMTCGTFQADLSSCPVIRDWSTAGQGFLVASLFLLA
jgi:hypothetical protein